jgi:TonB family protein
MATTEISTPSTSGLDPHGRGKRPVSVVADPQEIPIELLHLQDKLSRSRVREAFWISVMVHLFAIIAVSTMPHWVPGYKVTLISPADMFKHQDETFLALPPDLQKPTVKPKTNVLSDKDRIAESRHPELNRKELQNIIDASRAGRPGTPAPQQQQMASSSPPAPQMPPQGGQQQGSGGPPVPQQQAKLESLPPGGATRNNNPFAAALSGMSAGSAIQNAARATAGGRGVGEGGDYGVGPRSNANVQGGLEVLSDTQGVDFGPYLQRVVFIVKRNWYNVIPEAAMPPILKKGRVSIEFAIMKDGRLAGMRLVGQSGDISLDRAAWSGITASNPFPPLPTQYTGQYLALRFHFFYNPDRNDMQ